MNRKGFLAASATAAAVVPGGAHLVERRSDFDAATFAKAVGRPAEIRQVVEAVAFRPSMLVNVKNALNGLQFGFGYPASSIAVALAGHGPSAVYAYADSVWSTYRLGEFFKLSDSSGCARSFQTSSSSDVRPSIFVPIPTTPQACTRTPRLRCCSSGA